MKNFNPKGFVALLVVVVMLASARPSRAEEEKPPAKSNKKPVPEKVDPAVTQALNTAITGLTKEYQSAARENKPLRIKCDYLTAMPPQPPIPPAVLITALEKKMKGDAGLQGYVKWQLMSGLPSVTEPESADAMVAAYEKVPPLTPRYGLSEKDKKELDRLVSGGKQEKQREFQAAMEKQGDRIDYQNTQVLNYRDELAARLPNTGDAVRAMIKDAYERFHAGLDFKTFRSTLCTTLNTWSAEAKPRETAKVAGMLKTILAEPAVVYYSAPKFDSKKGTFSWTTDSVTFDASKSIEDLASELAQKAGQSGSDKGSK